MILRLFLQKLPYLCNSKDLCHGFIVSTAIQLLHNNDVFCIIIIPFSYAREVGE